jgi:hypothetical protein
LFTGGGRGTTLRQATGEKPGDRRPLGHLASGSREQLLDLLDDRVGSVDLDVVSGVVDGDEACRR